MSTLIVYASKYGFTKACAQRLADQLTDQTDLHHLKQDALKDVSSYDTIVIGSPIYAGKIRKEADDFCEKHADMLQTKRLGLFICGMQKEEAVLDELRSSFPPELMQHAVVSAYFGGEYNFEKMSFLDRIIVKAIAKTTASQMNLKEDTIREFAKKLNSVS